MVPQVLQLLPFTKIVIVMSVHYHYHCLPLTNHNHIAMGAQHYKRLSVLGSCGSRQINRRQSVWRFFDTTVAPSSLALSGIDEFWVLVTSPASLTEPLRGSE